MGRQYHHYDEKELFEPNEETLTDKSGQLFEENMYTTKAIEELNESISLVEGFEISKKGVISPKWIRLSANRQIFQYDKLKVIFDCMMILIAVTGMISWRMEIKLQCKTMFRFLKEWWFFHIKRWSFEVD